jgi:hypothetical protein
MGWNFELVDGPCLAEKAIVSLPIYPSLSATHLSLQ